MPTETSEFELSDISELETISSILEEDDVSLYLDEKEEALKRSSIKDIISSGRFNTLAKPRCQTWVRNNIITSGKLVRLLRQLFKF